MNRLRPACDRYTRCGARPTTTGGGTMRMRLAMLTVVAVAIVAAAWSWSCFGCPSRHRFGDALLPVPRRLARHRYQRDRSRSCVHRPRVRRPAARNARGRRSEARAQEARLPGESGRIDAVRSQPPTEVLSCGSPRFYKNFLYAKGTQLAEAVSFLRRTGQSRPRHDRHRRERPLTLRRSVQRPQLPSRTGRLCSAGRRAGAEPRRDPGRAPGQPPGRTSRS